MVLCATKLKLCKCERWMLLNSAANTELNSQAANGRHYDVWGIIVGCLLDVHSETTATHTLF